MTHIVFKDGQQRKQVLEILFEDDDLLVVNKPAHLPVIPDRFGAYNYNVRDLLQKHYKSATGAAEIWVIHRIDADTSGIVLFARNSEYHRLMNTLFEERLIVKYYLAITEQVLPEDEGLIDEPLLKTARKVIVHQKGKASQTEFKTLERFDNFGLVELKPVTGRTHQIRVHLKSVGCPLLVDQMYGKRKEITLAHIKRGYHAKHMQQPRPLCNRLTLHAHRVEFKDPKTGEHRNFEAPLPKDLMAVLKALRKYSAVKENLEI